MSWGVYDYPEPPYEEEYIDEDIEADKFDDWWHNGKDK